MDAIYVFRSANAANGIGTNFELGTCLGIGDRIFYGEHVGQPGGVE